MKKKKNTGVWKSFPTLCLYTEPVLVLRWCSDTARCYGNSYTLARHTRDRTGDRWGHENRLFLTHSNRFCFLQKLHFCAMAHFPLAYPCNTEWKEGHSMQISELSKRETQSVAFLLKNLFTQKYKLWNFYFILFLYLGKKNAFNPSQQPPAIFDTCAEE